MNVSFDYQQERPKHIVRSFVRSLLDQLRSTVAVTITLLCLVPFYHVLRNRAIE